MNGFTIREMENVARSMDGDIGLSNELGNVIDITDSSDALGLNMLMNQSKVSQPNNNNGNTVILVAPGTASSRAAGRAATARGRSWPVDSLSRAGRACGGQGIAIAVLARLLIGSADAGVALLLLTA